MCPLAEAVHLANLLCQHGYFFPVGDTRSLAIRDDSTLYRFQVGFGTFVKYVYSWNNLESRLDLALVYSHFSPPLF